MFLENLSASCLDMRPQPKRSFGLSATNGKRESSEIRTEGDESCVRLRVDRLQLRHVVEPHVLVLVKKHRDFIACHALLFLVEEPRHAVEENRAARPPADFLAGRSETFGVAEAKHGISPSRSRTPFVEVMHDDTFGEHVSVQWLPFVARVRRDKMHLDFHVQPDKNLVVKLRSGAAVKSRETVHKNSGDGLRHAM